MTTPRTVAMSLNRRMIRRVYPQIDWDEYDREVMQDQATAPALDAERLAEALLHADLNIGVPIKSGEEDYYHRMAEEVAAIYARLASTDEEGTA